MIIYLFLLHTMYNLLQYLYWKMTLPNKDFHLVPIFMHYDIYFSAFIAIFDMFRFHKTNVNWMEMERVHELNKFTFFKKQWMWPELNSFFQIWMWSEFYSSKKGTYNALLTVVNKENFSKLRNYNIPEEKEHTMLWLEGDKGRKK